MSDAEIVQALLGAYRWGSTSREGDWFMVKLNDDVREEFDRRLNEEFDEQVEETVEVVEVTAAE